MELTSIAVEPLSRLHDRTDFHCGAEALDRYLKQQARQDADKRVAAPFVAVRPPETRVLGYYTLSASVLTLAELPDDLARQLPRYPRLPVTQLGRLAVDRSTKGQGLGNICFWMPCAAACPMPTRLRRWRWWSMPGTTPPRPSIGTTAFSPCRPSRAACSCRCAWWRSCWVSV